MHCDTHTLIGAPSHTHTHLNTHTHKLTPGKKAIEKNPMASLQVMNWWKWIIYDPRFKYSFWFKVAPMSISNAQIENAWWVESGKWQAWGSPLNELYKWTNYQLFKSLIRILIRSLISVVVVVVVLSREKKPNTKMAQCNAILAQIFSLNWSKWKILNRFQSFSLFQLLSFSLSFRPASSPLLFRCRCD